MHSRFRAILLALAMVWLVFAGCRPQFPSVAPAGTSLEGVEKTIARLSDDIRRGTTDPQIYLRCGKAFLRKAEGLRRRRISGESQEEIADQLEKAVALLSKASTLDSMSADVYYHYGLALSAQGADWPRIVSSLERARRLDPGNVQIITDLGVAYLRRSGLWPGMYFDRSELPVWIEPAREVLEAAVALDPTYARSHLRLGEVYFIQGRFRNAIGQFRQAITLGVQDPDECLRLSYVYPLCAGDALQETVKWVPDVAKLALIPAFVLLSSEHLAFQGMQIHLVQRAAALDTNYAYPLGWLIPLLVAGGDPAVAIKCYFRLRQIDSTSSLNVFTNVVGPAYGFYSWFGADFFRDAVRQNPAAAILRRDLGDLYSGILEMNPRTEGVQARDQRAGLLYTYLDSAIAEYEGAIRLNPRLGASYTGLATVHAKKGDTAQSIRYYRDALATSDRTITTTVIRGLVEIGQLDEASRLVKDLIKDSRSRSRMYEEIATSHFLGGSSKRAEEFFLKSLAEDGRNSAAEEMMGRIYGKRASETYRSLLGCDVVAGDGVRVAVITTDTAMSLSFSKANNSGVWFNLPEGNSISPASRYNRESPYGGTYGSLSPFNPTTTTPPRLMRGKLFVSYLSDNPAVKPRVSASRLVGYLSERR